MGVFVVAWQAVMQACQPLPAHAALNDFDCFPFPDQDAKGFAIHGIAGFQLPDRESGAGTCLTQDGTIQGPSRLALGLLPPLPPIGGNQI